MFVSFPSSFSSSPSAFLGSGLDCFAFFGGLGSALWHFSSFQLGSFSAASLACLNAASFVDWS